MQSKIFTQLLTVALLLGAVSLQAQSPFYTEDFSDEATALANWTSGGDNDGPETWKWSNDPALGGIIDFSAPTAGNGFMVFDSDANGQNEHAVTLTSSALDCSGRDLVFLEMYTQYVYYFQGFSQVELGVSTDGTNFVYRDILTDVAPGYVYANAQRVTVEIPEAINQSTVYLQIKWTGFFEYFLHVDDISLYDSAPILANDLSITDVRYPLNYQTPISQVDSIFFLAIANNLGADPQTNTQMRVSVLDQDQNLVYQDSSEKTDMLMAGAMDTLSIEAGFLPSEIGTHFVFQTLEADEADNFGGNNREIYDFEITENVFAVDDGDFQNVFAPGGVGSGNFYEAGNFYFVPNGNGFQAEEIVFMVASDNNNSHIGETVTILMYKIEDDGEVGFTDDDLTLVGTSFYTFQSEDVNFQLITAPLLQDDAFTPNVPLEDSTDYLLFVSLPESIGLAYTYRDLPWEVGSVIRIGDDFFGRFSNADGGEIPLAFVARMVIGEAEPNAVKEPELADSRISSFPNPAREFYRIDLDLERSSPVQVQLLSMSGQMVLQREYTALQRDRIDLDVQDLPSGAYLVRVRTDEGVKTLKLTKQ